MLMSCVLWIPEFPRDGQDEASCDSQRALSLLHTVLAQGEMVMCSENE